MLFEERKYVNFAGVKISNVNYDEILLTIKKHLHKRAYICLTDVGNVVRASKDKIFREAINGSLISIPDGMPLVWYARLTRCRKIERIQGVDIMRKMLEDETDFKHFLLGDTRDTIDKIIYKAKKINKKIQISGYSPPMKNQFNENDNEIMLNKINQENPDIIWVSFGGGKQDKWMYQNVRKLDRGVMICVGKAFRFYIGAVKIPSQIVQHLGLQWLTVTFQLGSVVLRKQLETFPHFLFRFPWEVVKARRSK
jgi:N-acetylglucosaminyldiphosphoundecaprenol N-acetyl-beta-D-mannosaminyltransferase